MLSIDTNILLPAVEVSNPDHARAASFLAALNERSDVVVSELVLLELYGLLRNPAVLVRPLSAPSAVALCQRFRCHPKWRLLGFAERSKEVHDRLWSLLAEPGIARRKAYDFRLGLTLLHQGVDEFATINTKDFASIGFRLVWNPLST